MKNIAENNSFENNKKEPKIITKDGRVLLDVNNEEGALIGENGVTFISMLGKGSTEMLEDVDGVTSHCYFGCAEIVGTFSNGESFYFHSREPRSLKVFLDKIIALKGDDELKIATIDIRGEFDRNASIDKDEAQYAKEEMLNYRKICEIYAKDGAKIEIKHESISLNGGEKIVNRFE